MNRFLGSFGIVVVLALSLGFASLNGGQRVTLQLGIKTLYGVPLTAVAFGGLITGMVIMLVAGVQSDLKVRRILRDRLAEEDREERTRFTDLDQRELFEGGREPSEGREGSGGIDESEGREGPEGDLELPWGE
jgi:uncharacterized integral membrane protein